MSETKEAPDHEVIILTPDQKLLRQQCYDVRTEIFHHEQGFPLDTEIDQYDELPNTTHFLLRLSPSLTPIGTIRAYQPEGVSYYKLSRLAVLKDYRRFKFGGALVLALHNWTKAETIRVGSLDHATVIAHSQIYIKGFYAKYGYVPEGKEFEEEGAPHQKMVLRMPIGQ